MVTVVKAVLVAAIFCAAVLLSSFDQAPSPQTSSPGQGPAESLYLKLGSVGLDKAQVYKIREASIDRAKLHLSLDDGTIAFTEGVDGHITGAFFQGYGEVLLMPPNQVERASLSTFTGAAILEETFSTAYLRFNDDMLAELRPYLRPADDPSTFVSLWNMTARNLAGEDALRLFLTFNEAAPGATQNTNANDHMLHVYLQGNKLGGFDVRYDSLVPEQIQAGQHKRQNGDDYYDVWTSFAVPRMPNSGASGAIEPEEAPNPELDITQFRIQAQIKPVKELQARATLIITARQRTHRTLLFQLSRMLVVSQVSVNGRPVEFLHNQAVEGSHLARQGNDVVAVILSSPLQKGEKAELSFDYSGAVLSEAANGLLYVGDRGTWYPNVGFAMASFDLQFRYPVGWTLVAIGRRTGLNVSGNEQASIWKTERPVPVAGFNLGKYEQSTSQAGKVLVTTYATANVERDFPGTTQLADAAPPAVPDQRQAIERGLGTFPVSPHPQPPIPAGNAQTVSATAVRAIEFYEHNFGAYPYPELALTQMPGRLSQGWPGLIFLSSYAFLNADERARLESSPVRRLISEQVVAHETAHQWWGDLVNWNSYHDQWIMEGLANYSALMLLESRDPAAFRQVMQAYRDDLVAKSEKGKAVMDAGPVTLGFRLSSSEFPSAYEPVCYGRGTWLFHMLRSMMRDAQAISGAGARPEALNDEPFIRALRNLRQNYQGRAVSTAELLHVFEAELPSSAWYEGHKSLNWFYDGWVNGNAIPSFELRDVKFAAHGKKTAVSGTLVQEHAPDTLVTAVPLYASMAGKSIFLGQVFAEGDETSFRIVAPAGTRKVLIDPEHTLLSRAK